MEVVLEVRPIEISLFQQNRPKAVILCLQQLARFSPCSESRWHKKLPSQADLNDYYAAVG